MVMHDCCGYCRVNMLINQWRLLQVCGQLILPCQTVGYPCGVRFRERLRCDALAFRVEITIDCRVERAIIVHVIFIGHYCLNKKEYYVVMRVSTLALYLQCAAYGIVVKPVEQLGRLHRVINDAFHVKIYQDAAQLVQL